ncbi:MAG: hypothetical protein JNJ61_29185 [Anaerolineae bacterium]|nr:hypothetical protein [Anaerolineae bacterium]
MPARLPSPYDLLAVLLTVVVLLLSTALTTAQNTPPAPQFLYRNENRLILVNGNTGETVELSIEVATQDRFTWSPDGRYLLAQISEGENGGYCLNLYDVDAESWLYSETIACSIEDVLFSSDTVHIAYTTSDRINETLWLFSLVDKTSQKLFQTTGGTATYPDEIIKLSWSPANQYLSFISATQILSGPHTVLNVINIESLNYTTVAAPNTLFANYDPIWSANDRWFLIILKEEYLNREYNSNHQGDVYLVNSDTGEQSRITYTPAALEQDVRWTDNGDIAFTMVIQQEWTLTLEAAMNVEVVSPEDIVMPVEESYSPLNHTLISPDPYLGAWVSTAITESGETIYTISIGYIDPFKPFRELFSMPIRATNLSIPESVESGNLLIGWRPSDYPYPRR